VRNSSLRKELSLEEIEKISRGIKNLFQLQISGGEPFLRADLAEIVTFFYKNSGVAHVTIPTNGLMPEQSEKALRKIFESCPGLYVSVNVSIDGIGKRHDEIRGVIGNFDIAAETYRRLSPLRKYHKNFALNIDTRISKHNYHELEEIADFIEEKFAPDIHIVSPARPVLDGASREIAKEEAVGVYKRLREGNVSRVKKRVYFSKAAYALISLIYDIQRRVIEDGKMAIPCPAASKMIVISDIGEVFPCEPIWLGDGGCRLGREEGGIMGDLRREGYNMRRIVNSQRSRKMRSDIKKSKCFCDFGCAVYAGILYSPRAYFGILKKFFEVLR